MTTGATTLPMKQKWKTRSEGVAPTISQVEVNQAIMWLCAQPSVAKHIRKLWRNPVRKLARKGK